MTAKEKVLAVYPKARREKRPVNFGTDEVVLHVISSTTHRGATLGIGLIPQEAWNKAALLITDINQETLHTMPTRETPTHSPGPFTVDDDGEHWFLRDATGNIMGRLDGTSPADDRLILKAPELLAACRKHIIGCEMYGVESLDYAIMKKLVDHIDGTEGI